MLAILFASAALLLRPDTGPRRILSARMKQLPAKTLWVWERPEDLRGIDPAWTAIAWLDQTILIGDSLSVLPRRQSVIYPEASRRVAVVRIETQSGVKLSGDVGHRLVKETIDQIMKSARKSGIAALQIDFDATRSQPRR
jgi:hypothetical protein